MKVQPTVSLKAERKRVLRDYLAKKRLKITKQREIIFEEFFNHTEDHVSVEELYERIKPKNSKIGFATIYRTLKLFKECGLAFERNFGDGKTRYEPVNFSGEHHDHIICQDCGKIVCFSEQKLYDMLKEIGAKNHFKIDDYKLVLYGKCDPTCENARSEKRSEDAEA